MADQAPEAGAAAADSTPLPRPFYERATAVVARSLLGCVLISIRDGVVAGGRIVETEAYFGADDPASHAARRRTGRAAVMSGRAGIAYVYRSYGIHAMLNVVAHEPEATGAVLLRAVEPVWCVEAMRRRRGIDDLLLLSSGPGRLCQALAVGLDDHGHDLVSGPPFWIGPGTPPASVLVSGRIGVSRAAAEPWRFFAAENRFVSAHRRGIPDPPR